LTAAKPGNANASAAANISDGIPSRGDLLEDGARMVANKPAFETVVMGFLLLQSPAQHDQQRGILRPLQIAWVRGLSLFAAQICSEANGNFKRRLPLECIEDPLPECVSTTTRCNKVRAQSAERKLRAH
jgi:hypothetical protein